MKATGIVRRVDDLGRVVIPKEIRRSIRIDELGVPHSYIELSDKHTLFNFYCATQTESAKVKAIAN